LRRPLVIVISDAFRLDPLAITRLESAGFEVRARHDLAGHASPEALGDALKGAWAVVAGVERYSGELIDGLRDLRAIARPGVGYDAIDIHAAGRRGIAVLTTPGANDDSVADHTLALMLAVCRRLVENDQATRRGEWRTVPIARDLAGASVGILGLGAIGRAVAMRLSGFGCELRAVEPNPDWAFCRRYGIEILDLHTVAARSTILTVHLPLTPSTAGFVDRAVLWGLPRAAILVNTSRGRIVHEDALLEALLEGQLGGAGLDVFADEPIASGHPLTRIASALLTPHIGALTEGAVKRMVDMTISNLCAWRDGEMPASCVNAEGMIPREPGARGDISGQTGARR
jgi:D-3-phosphoglycerate dehydrogenase